jgi:hypothetical protein
MIIDFIVITIGYFAFVSLVTMIVAKLDKC